MWISLSRQQSSRDAGFLMPSATRSSIPPPGPPARPGVLIFRPPCPSDPLQISYISSDTAPTTSCFPHACLGSNNADCIPTANATDDIAGTADIDVSSATASLNSSTNGRAENIGNKELNIVKERPVTPQTLEGLPIPPPSRFKRFTSFIWGNKTERRKSTDRTPGFEISSSREGAACPSAPRLIGVKENQNQSSYSSRAGMAWGSPNRNALSSRSPQGFNECPWNQNTPPRKSFKLASHIPDLSSERNMLPLWLEETHEISKTSVHPLPNNRDDTTLTDNSFETRWDSMRERTKRRTPISTVRPPGWENIGQRERQRNTKAGKSNFRPSFTIRDVPKDNLQQQTQVPIQPIAINIEPPPLNTSSDLECYMNRKPHQNDPFDMGDLSENINSIFTNSIFQEQPQNSNSKSRLTPTSTSDSPSQTSNSGIITDRHLWASTDSFICEDFSFCKDRPVQQFQQEVVHSQSPPRSYSQVILSHPEADHNEFTDDDGMYADRSTHLNDEHIYDDIDSVSLNSTHLQSINGNMCVTDPWQSKCIEPVNDNYDLSGVIEEIESRWNDVCMDPTNPTLKVSDNLPRPSWISFDSSSTQNLEQVSEANINYEKFPQTENNFDLVHQSNFNEYRRNSPDPLTSPTSPTSPVLLRNCSGSTLNLVEPRLQQTSETYKGELVRNYSIRGRQTSKKVSRSVSQRMRPPEYGKLIEPKAPILSRAALTMSCGPGLFEQHDLNSDMTPTSYRDKLDSPELHVKLDVPVQDNKKISNPTTRTKSSNSTGLPNRSGSLRVPHMPRIFLRRSVSLNAPKVNKGDVPFQRLPEKRGSFRKAISGLGAMARNLRRKSGSHQTKASESSQVPENVPAIGNSSRLHRSGSIGAAPGRQTPKAPRLPRRAISYRHTASDN